MIKKSFRNLGIIIAMPFLVLILSLCMIVIVIQLLFAKKEAKVIDNPSIDKDDFSECIL